MDEDYKASLIKWLRNAAFNCQERAKDHAAFYSDVSSGNFDSGAAAAFEMVAKMLEKGEKVQKNPIYERRFKTVMNEEYWDEEESDEQP